MPYNSPISFIFLLNYTGGTGRYKTYIILYIFIYIYTVLNCVISYAIILFYILIRLYIYIYIIYIYFYTKQRHNDWFRAYWWVLFCYTFI